MAVEKLIAGILGFLLGVFGLWTAFRLLKNRSLLNQWKTTKGRVIERGIFRPDHAMLSTPRPAGKTLRIRLPGHGESDQLRC